MVLEVGYVGVTGGGDRRGDSEGDVAWRVGGATSSLDLPRVGVVAGSVGVRLCWAGVARGPASCTGWSCVFHDDDGGRPSGVVVRGGPLGDAVAERPLLAGLTLMA